MARSSLTINKLLGASVADPAGDAADETDGHKITLADLTIAGITSDLGQVCVRVVNGDSSETVVSILAREGDDLDVTVADGATSWLGPFPSRFKQQSDTDLLHIDVSNETSVTLTAFLIDDRRI